MQALAAGGLAGEGTGTAGEQRGGGEGRGGVYTSRSRTGRVGVPAMS